MSTMAMSSSSPPLLLFLLLILVMIYGPPAATSIAPPPNLQGEWRLLHESVGISAMHMQLMHDNKVVMFDRTDFGPSNLSLPGGHCRFDPSDMVLKTDCTAHSILYDVPTNTFRPLTVQTDTWCSSGAVLPDGTLVQTGGYNDGDRVIRRFSPCGSGEECDWVEFTGYLAERRWYATNQVLPDGRVIIVGGRREFSYEFYPQPQQRTKHTYFLDFLRETRDSDENNLYPFVHLLPDGYLFIFANTRSISFDYSRNRIVKIFPPIPGNEPRNYPSSGSSVMLPLDENEECRQVEIMVCGGASPDAFAQAARGNYTRALATCGRLKVSDPNPTWLMESMPMPRVMGDMLLLPNGDVIIVNGAMSGTAGWESGRDPVTRPVIYRPRGQVNWRFSVVAPSPRPRMYHSSTVLLADGRVLVGGSNPHVFYNFTGVEYPTDISLEAYSPPYMSGQYDRVRPNISTSYDGVFNMGYREFFSVRFSVREFLSESVVSARLVAPSFTTHSLAMNQRMVVLRMIAVTHTMSFGTYTLTTVGPSTPEIAPPGYYMLFLVHAGVPSPGAWVKLQ